MDHVTCHVTFRSTLNPAPKRLPSLPRWILQDPASISPASPLGDRCLDPPKIHPNHHRTEEPEGGGRGAQREEPKQDSTGGSLKSAE